MIVSLKTYSPVLARYLASTPDTLYERQRRLSQAGLLTGVSGRGPGSGIRLNPSAVSVMVVAALAMDGLAEIDLIVQNLLSLRSAEKRCKFTGAASFGEAMSLILASPEMAALVWSVEVQRPAIRAHIHFKSRKKNGEFSTFEDRNTARRRDPSVMDVRSQIQGQALQQIANDVAQIIAGRRPSSMAAERGDL